MTETLTIADLDFEVRRSTRRRTVGVTVDRAGELIVHAPATTTAEDLSRWVSKKLLWVHRKLALKETSTAKMRAPEYVSGETFCYLGRRYRLKVVEHQEQPLRFNGTQFTLRRNARPADEHFRRWYISTGSEWLKHRVAFISARTTTKPKRVEVRDLGFRWGSCGKNGVLFFNWKLLQLPVRLADYVIAHELTHLSEPLHDSAFAQTLSRAMPDWEKRKAALADRAKEYLVFGLAVAGRS
jgi:predicted metal-dependent hydrolase